MTPPLPRFWRWLKQDGSISLGPRTHGFLEAVAGRADREVTSRITAAEFEALRSYWKPGAMLIEPNDAGWAIIKDRSA